MIISRTPLRISFCGGGSDYPQFYLHYGDGAVLGTTIDKYCYVVLHDGESCHFFDLPNKSGLASSSAYTVGLLRACTELDKDTIAKLATTWEQDKMNGNVGSQDQYLCSHGGFHLLRFSEQGIRDTTLPEDIVKPLEGYLMLFDTHQYRRSGDIIARQLEHLKKNRKILTRMGAMVDDGLYAIYQKDWTSFGKLLDEAWTLKRQLSKYVSTPSIDVIYTTAIKAGATGGKLLGGGGGGFIIFLTEPDKQESVKKALSDLTYVPFEFENVGSVVIYKDS